MPSFSTEPFDYVRNSQQYTYLKLLIDGECMVDSLMKEIETNAQLKKDFAAIVRYMEMLSDRILLPKEKFRHIVSDERSDLFEFKKGILRIYVIKQKPDVYVVCGGLKTNQKKDIQSFKKKIKDFKTI